MTLQPAVSSVRVGDIDIAYRFNGPQDAPVVLLSHGIMTTHGIWDRLMPYLQGQWRILRYDLRGHGASSASQPSYAMTTLADDAVGLLDVLKIEKAHFIGSSLGGMIGQQVGAKYGQRLLSLTLANTTARQGTVQAWTERIALARKSGLTPILEPTLQRWFTQGLFASEPTLMTQMRQLMQQTSLQGFLGCAAAVRDLAQTDLLASITVPTLILAGEQDTATPMSDAIALQQGIKNAKLVAFPVAHQSAVECPEAFATAWRKFQAELAPNNMLRKIINTTGDYK